MHTTLKNRDIRTLESTRNAVYKRKPGETELTNSKYHLTRSIKMRERQSK